MRKDYLVYLVAILVIVASFASAAYLPIPAEFKGMITLPGVIALFEILLQAWRDQRAHERSLELQTREHSFTLSIASHMANTTFDRQVTFCEEYFKAAYDILHSLFRTGPSQEAVTHSQQLTDIRLKFSPWLTSEMESGLLPFERALRTIATNAMLVEAGVDSPTGAKAVQTMYAAFIQLINIEPLPPGGEAEEGAARVINHLRQVLRINELTSLRDNAISAAFTALPRGPGT
jgi:hypothetical protein